MLLSQVSILWRYLEYYSISYIFSFRQKFLLFDRPGDSSINILDNDLWNSCCLLAIWCLECWEYYQHYLPTNSFCHPKDLCFSLVHHSILLDHQSRKLFIVHLWIPRLDIWIQCLLIPYSCYTNSHMGYLPSVLQCM